MAEFSRLLPLGLVGVAGRQETIEAGPEECAALALRLGIPAVDALRAVLRLAPEADGTVLVRGQLSARVTQDCVVTLEPVAQQIEEGVAFRLLPPGRDPADGPEDLDEVPCGPDGVADLGEAMAEQLALALDPYPRAPGAALPEEALNPPDSPFARLAALRNRDG